MRAVGQESSNSGKSFWSTSKEEERAVHVRTVPIRMKSSKFFSTARNVPRGREGDFLALAACSLILLGGTLRCLQEVPPPNKIDV